MSRPEWEISEPSSLISRETETEEATRDVTSSSTSETSTRSEKTPSKKERTFLSFCGVLSPVYLFSTRPFISENF